MDPDLLAKETINTFERVRRGEANVQEIEYFFAYMNELQRKATVNQVTGVPGKPQLRIFLRKIKEEQEKWGGGKRREDLPHQGLLYVTVIDVHDFGKINKLYGEETGSEVLTAIAQAGQRVTRPDDVFIHEYGDTMLSMLSYIPYSEDDPGRIPKGVVGRTLEAATRATRDYFSQRGIEREVHLGAGVTAWPYLLEPKYNQPKERADAGVIAGKAEKVGGKSPIIYVPLPTELEQRLLAPQPEA